MGLGETSGGLESQEELSTRPGGGDTPPGVVRIPPRDLNTGRRGEDSNPGPRLIPHPSSSRAVDLQPLTRDL